jgi:ATP-binding cassette subfamily A (ABC1) protein 3
MPIVSLASIFDGSLPLYWSALPLNHSRTNPTLTPDAIMSRLSQGFNPAQSKAIIKVNSTDDVGAACAQNFNGFSACFAAVIFDPPPPEFYFGGAKFPNRTAEYTIQVDTGLQSIDVRGRSGYERRIMPLQFAIDNAITELSSGYTLPTPSEWPFTELTNEEVALYARLSTLPSQE